MIRVAVNGYGNLGRGAEQAVSRNDDMELAVVFTRRDPDSLTTQGAPVAHVDDMPRWADKVDVCLNCGGSATDLDQQGPATAAFFTTVDSFDTHARIPEYFASVDAAARQAGNLALISTGWDPGLFSMLRVLGEAVLPEGATTTFWGPGVSQGHSDALRRVDGVLDARQYTLPVEETLAAVRAGEEVELTTRSMHRRDCYVVAEEGADLARVEREIVEMPNYFADYDTTVTFVTAEEMAAEHSGIPHGGTVVRRGTTSEGAATSVGFDLQLGSNPEFTGSVVAAMGRAAARMAARGEAGARTVFDVTLADLSARTPEDLRAHYL
ncbi:diaminopimelate dehydrogenase [Actinomyces wuliandei]|uniref:diaminopimelate dehydrogenase n=1 Tax=Actinomyces wuliandei TaxID=2057743 RepID=UPI000FDCA342|nr:diaminopimelate dehydrogenase [Actinomyces wuliandei]